MFSFAYLPQKVLCIFILQPILTAALMLRSLPFKFAEYYVLLLFTYKAQYIMNWLCESSDYYEGAEVIYICALTQTFLYTVYL